MADRPTPLMNAARMWALVSGAVGAVASFLVTNQVLTTGQADALGEGSAAGNLLISAVTAVITAGAGIVSAFAVAKQGQSEVTPVDSPRDREGRRLVPEIPPTV